MSEALYVYGFLPPASQVPPVDLVGPGGRKVELIEIGVVVAALSRVPAEEFDRKVLEQRVRDLEWMTEQGALHERVVTWFVDHGEILPARFLTLYSGVEALLGAVSPRAEALARELERLSGHREWDLKVTYDAVAIAARLGELSPEVAHLDREIGEASPGRRHLLDRKRRQLVKREASQAARRQAGELHAKLSRSSREAVVLPLPAEGRDVPVVLSAAYLVPRAKEERLRRTGESEGARLRALGMDVRLTGPWAPYRFISADEVAPRDGGADGGT